MNSENIWCWLLFLLAGAIGVLLGYLWGKGKRVVIDNSSQLQALEEKNSQLQADLDACNKSMETGTVTTAKTPTSSLGPTNEMAFDAASAKKAFGRRIKQDDLKIVEGIGPKIENLFHDFDIKTWKALSEVTVNKCQEVLNSGGDRYRIHDPSSWPMQAKMANEGKWKDLVRWQNEHKAGKF